MAEESIQQTAQQILEKVDELGSTKDPVFESTALQFVSLGEPALQALLRSVATIYSELHRELTERNAEKLRLRVALLCRFNDEKVVRPIMDALVDSSRALLPLKSELRGLKRQVESNPMLMELIPIAEGRIFFVESLKHQSVSALVQLGEMALAHVERFIPIVPEHLRRPFFKVRARILKQWWKLCFWWP